MTPLDTTQFSSEEITHLTTEQIQTLPTIIEVLEYISALENATMRKYLREPGMQGLFHEGLYAPMSDQAWTNQAKLYPCSQTTFTLMRGQHTYFPNSYPAIFREEKGMPDEDHWLISRLKACEFIAVMRRHPVVQVLKNLCCVEYMAVAQHYGFHTEYMDITNQKWVAAFFACTRYVKGNYVPVVPDKDTKIGVLYIGESEKEQTYPPNIKALGFHYFERPTRQYAMVYQMNRGENFDTDPFFKRIVFRHDAAASQFVYNMAYDQLRYFPKDSWAEIAAQIREPDYPICQSAIEISRCYGVKQSDDEIKAVLARYKIPFVQTDSPKALPSSQQIEWDCKVWNNYICPNLSRRVLRLPPFFRF